jgi:hypothetical protein
MRTVHGALAALALIAPLATPGPGLAQTPSTDFRTYAVIAGSQIKLGSGALVLGGNAAATDVDGILMVGKGASCPVLGDAVGDRAKLLNGANVGRQFSNEPILRRLQHQLRRPVPVDPANHLPQPVGVPHRRRGYTSGRGRSG